MDKDLLIEIMNNARENIYSWSLYFFKIDRRNNNPFTAYKIRFKNNEYLPEYARILIDMVVKYQLVVDMSFGNSNGIYHGLTQNKWHMIRRRI